MNETLQDVMPIADPSPVPAPEADTRQAEAAYQQGLEEGRAAAAAEAEQRLEQQRSELEQHLAAAREAWCGEEGTRASEQIKAGLAEIEGRVSATVEHLLRPFLAEAVRAKAIADLQTTLHDLLARKTGAMLEVSGPQPLLDALSDGLSDTGAAIVCVPADGCEVQVRTDGSIIQTQIAEWLKHIEGQ
jgi:hypothetical protein